MASSVPTARTNLYAGLLALTTTGQPLEGVGVYRTGLWSEAQAHDRVTVLNARDVQRQVAALSTQTPMREEFTLTLSVEVYRTGSDVAYVEDRLWGIITEVERYVVTNKTLAGAVSKAIPGRVDEQSGPSSSDEDTVIAMATLNVDCMTAHVLLT